MNLRFLINQLKYYTTKMKKQLAKELRKVGLTLLDHSNKTRDDFFELIYSDK